MINSSLEARLALRTRCALARDDALTAEPIEYVDEGSGRILKRAEAERAALVHGVHAFHRPPQIEIGVPGRSKAAEACGLQPVLFRQASQAGPISFIRASREL